MNGHTLVAPVIKPGVADCIFDIASVLVALATQATACTEMLEPETKLLVNETVMIVSFTPAPFGCETIVAPVGTDQLYEVALATGAMK